MAHKQAFASLTTASPTVDILTTPVAVTRALTGVTIFCTGANQGVGVLTLYLEISSTDWQIYSQTVQVGTAFISDLHSNMDGTIAKLHAAASGLPAGATIEIGVAYDED